MIFNYSIYSRGMGFHQFYSQFKNDNLLTMEQIKFIVHCKMLDRKLESSTTVNNSDLEILSLTIASSQN